MTWIIWIVLASVAFVATVLGHACYGASRWAVSTRELLRRLEVAHLHAGPSRYDARELESLPAPVQRYFHAVLRDGQPIVAAVSRAWPCSFATPTGRRRDRTRRTDAVLRRSRLVPDGLAAQSGRAMGAAGRALRNCDPGRWCAAGDHEGQLRHRWPDRVVQDRSPGCNGCMRVPSTGEAAWLTPQGCRPYWRGTIATATYPTGRLSPINGVTFAGTQWKSPFLRRFLTSADHGRSLWIVAHRSRNASAGMSGCRIRLCGWPSSSSRA